MTTTNMNYDFKSASVKALRPLLAGVPAERLKEVLLHKLDDGVSNNQYILLHEACIEAHGEIING